MHSFIRLLFIFILSARALVSISYAQPATPDALRQGLRYQKITTPLKQKIHLLEIDPTQVNIIPVHAKGKAIGRETVASIAKRHQAIAAINGGFFKSGEWAEGLAAGILKIHDQWYGIAYQSRGAIGWSNKPEDALIDRIQTKTRLYLNHRQFPVHALNRPGLSNRAILYTDAYGKHTHSAPGGYDIVIQNNRILRFEASGHTLIPKDGYVYSIGAKVKYPNHPLEIGNSVSLNIETIPRFGKKEQSPAWQNVENIVGGAPLLIYQGRVLYDYSMEHLRSTFIQDRYARTAVATLKNGHWIFVVVEQSVLSGSAGMTLPELATFMQELGAEYALNLDGGASSTLYINNAVINHPEGEEDEDYGWAALRPVSDAILVVKRS